jgi:hypothetical protein
LRPKLRDAKAAPLITKEHFDAIRLIVTQAQKSLSTMLQKTSGCIVSKAKLFSGWLRRKSRWLVATGST